MTMTLCYVKIITFQGKHMDRCYYIS